jgi:hypothetical protein
MRLKTINEAGLYSIGLAIYCYKRSFNNLPQKFYFHKDVNLKEKHLYSNLYYDIIYRDGNNNLIGVVDVSPLEKTMIRDFLRLDVTVSEAVNMILL